MSKVKVSVLKDGPLKVEGEIELVDAEGSPIPTRAGKAAYLCRCGASKTKPFCDGTHSKIGFIGAEAAVRAMESEA